MIFPTQFRNLISHNITLFYITIRLKHTDGFPFFFLREHGFPNLTFVLFNQTIGSTNNGLRRTVILFQFKDFRVGIDFRKIENIINIRPTERIDTLRIVSHHTDTLILLCQLQNNAMLRIIRILILIHQHITELFPIACQHFRKVTK